MCIGNIALFYRGPAVHLFGREYLLFDIGGAVGICGMSLMLISSAVRHKRYPPAALDNDWQGDVLVRLSVAASGSVAEVSVKASSGHAQLDEQALEMFRLAAAEVPVPPALRGQEFGFEVRASYELQR